MKKLVLAFMMGAAAMAANAQVNYKVQTACHPQDVKHYDTELLRSRFMMDKVMAPDEINVTYTLYDRLIYGGAMPVNKTLKLEVFRELGPEITYFLERRELGVINTGGDGVVTVDGKEYPMKYKEALYVGCGNKEVTFKSNDATNPAKFYINSAPAYKPYVTQLITTDAKLQKANPKKYALGISDHYGKMEDSNDRIVNQLIVKDVLERVKDGGTNQLQMGLTELAPGSVWNTMPAHTHTRRMEAYYYFNLKPGNAICHLMGEPQEERLIWLHNEQAITSPEWSIHAAAGTSNYTFIWRAMEEVNLLSVISFPFFYYISHRAQCCNQFYPKTIIYLCPDIPDVYINDIGFSGIVVSAHKVQQFFPVHDNIFILHKDF